MKKKLLECPIHGLTLHRCKRRCWAGSSKKDKSFADEYTEKCYKCMQEGRIKKKRVEVVKRNKHIKMG